jgi:hypothetical protein
MMHAHGFDHGTDVLPAGPDAPAATGEPTSFHLADDNVEVLYVPGDHDYWEAIERPSATSTPGRGPSIGP